jgi:ABC-type glycerol-3-phosphate transport system substrate-binding protein
MKRYSRRHFLRTATLTAAGAGMMGSAPRSLAAAPQAAKAITLEYTNRWGKNNDTHYLGMVSLFKQFKKIHPEISFKLVVLPPGPDYQKDMADCGAGACPDIMNDMSGVFWTDGYLLDLTPYLQAAPAWKAAFDAQSLAFMNTNGHQWGLCNELSPIAMGWNTQLLDKAGVSAVPATWNQLLDACEKIKKLGIPPTSFAYGGLHMFHDLVVGQKGGYEAIAASKFEAPQFLEAFKRLKVFVDNKWLPDDEIQQTYLTASALFQAGRLGYYMDGIWSIKNNITTKSAPPDLRKQVQFSAFPALKGGTIVENKVSTIVGLSAGLSKDQSKLEGAVAFLKFFLSPSMAAQWIPLTWSPMAVKVDLKSIHGLDALPAGWLAAREHATVAYSMPSTPGMQDHQWDDGASGLTALLQGKSAEAAQAALVQFMAKYMKK